MQRTRRQHFVPQFYLRRFCKDGKGCFAFDKTTRTRFPARVSDIALQTDFYDLPGDLVKKACPGEDLDIQLVKKAFANVEGWAKPIFDEILAAADRYGIIPRTLRLQLAPYIILQLLRTRLSRDLLAEMAQKFREAEVNAYLQEKKPEVAKHVHIIVELDPKVLPVMQAGVFFDEDHILKMASIINQHIWFVGINNTIQPYYTSDHPVVKKANRELPGRSFSGLRSPGIELAFPLDSRHILVMLERSHFRNMAKFDGLAAPMDPFGVEHFNSLQVVKCNRQVYCETDQFEQAEGVCRRYPDACSPGRSRVQGVQTENLFGMVVSD